MKRTILFFIIFFIISCVSEDETKTVVVNDKYSIELPKFLNKTNNLNDDASLQYQHILKQFYIIVIDESKGEFSSFLKINNLNYDYVNDINSYFTLINSSIKEIGKVYKEYSTNDTIINNLPAKITSFDINIDGENCSWILCIFEGKDNYYQLLICTSVNKRLKYHDVSKKTINSFKEI